MKFQGLDYGLWAFNIVAGLGIIVSLIVNW